MSGRGSKGRETSRRKILEGVGAVGIASFLPVQPARAGSTVSLGDFESSFDGWGTDGGNELTRVSADDVPTVVSSGEYALKVDGNGDPRPSIERIVRDADFEGHPYLVADVTASIIGSLSEAPDSSVTFRLQYRYDRSGGKGGNGETGKPVVDSPPIEVPQGYQGQIFWNMTSIEEDLRANPNRLTISWALSAAETRDVASGRGPGRGYDGEVYFDDVRLTDSRSEFLRISALQQIKNLVARHGTYEYEFESAGQLSEKGYLVFYDGTEVPILVELVGGDRRLKIGEEVYRFGGEQQ